MQTNNILGRIDVEVYATLHANIIKYLKFVLSKYQSQLNSSIGRCGMTHRMDMIE